MSRAWSLITLGDGRQYGGNEGYQDRHGSLYRYDSNVANCKQVNIGDIVVLRDNLAGYGVAKVEHISIAAGKKLMRRCPICNTTGIKVRARRTPRWRCSSGHEFESPIEQEQAVTNYEAHFPRSFLPLSTPIPSVDLKGLALRPSDQLSIEELDLARLEQMLSNDRATMHIMSQAAVLVDLAADDAETSDPASFVPSMVDRREAVARSIKVRRGQAAFRKGLIRRYGPRCMVSGCAILDLLEAAHIAAYRGPEYNHLDNGLLLRADIHTLFDLNLMWIEPETLKVGFDPIALNGEYDHLEGLTLRANPRRPSPSCLRLRYEAVEPAHRIDHKAAN